MGRRPKPAFRRRAGYGTRRRRHRRGAPARPTPERPVKGKRKKVKKRKGLGRRFLEEAFDALEDIFD